MTYDDEIIALAAQIEATDSADAVHLPEGGHRDEAQAWLREHSQRLGEQIAKDHRLTPRAVRCNEGCRLFEVYDIPSMGPVIVKTPMTRGKAHAEREASPETKTRLIVAPVEVLIAAAGGQPIAGLLACEDHLEASLSPAALRWIAARPGTLTVDPAALPHKGIDVRVWSP